MASIIKRKKNYSIVYTYVDENGETKQKWETRSSYQDALKRKAEVEKQLGENGRVLVRASGTEPLIRIMLEGKDEKEILDLALSLAHILVEKYDGKIRT